MTFSELLEVLGNLGEFVGAIAVFATLIYLAVQVRATRRSTDFLIAQGLTAQYNQVNTLLVENPELGELLYKSARNSDSITSQERDRLGYLMIQWFLIFDYVLELGKREIIDGIQPLRPIPVTMCRHLSRADLDHRAGKYPTNSCQRRVLTRQLRMWIGIHDEIGKKVQI